MKQFYLSMVALFVLACDDKEVSITAQVKNIGSIHCEDDEHGAESFYMDRSNTTRSIKLTLSYTCIDGIAVYEVRQ